MIRYSLLICTTLFVFVVVLETVHGLATGKDLKCYQCNSLSQPQCADFFDNKTVPLYPCPNDGKNYTRCRKIVEEIYYDGRWERRYFRDCAVTGHIGWEEGRWCTDRLGTYRVKMRYCHCDNREGCNSADRLQSGVLFMSNLWPGGGWRLFSWLFQLISSSPYPLVTTLFLTVASSTLASCVLA